VTSDQPLFQKASEIVAASNNLHKVVVRLGGFHLLMSYLGSIGQIMSGSGLAELWERVYAKGSVVHMAPFYPSMIFKHKNILKIQSGSHFGRHFEFFKILQGDFWGLLVCC